MIDTQSLKHKAKKGLYWKFLQQFSNYGVGLIIGILMARMLSPEDYGLTAIPAVFFAISGLFISGGFGVALVRKPELSEKDLSTAFYYSLCVGIVCYIVLYLLAPYIAEFYDAPILTDLMRVTAINFLYSPLGTPQSVILQRQLDFKTPAKISVVCQIFSGIVGIYLAYTGYGVWALAISGLASGILNIVILLVSVRWLPKTGWSNESFKYLWGFGNKMVGSWLIGTIYENIAPLIIGKFFSPAQLGVYNRALGYASIPSKNITNTIQAVSFPVLSKLQDDDSLLSYGYRKMIRLSAFFVFPIMLLLAAIARPLIILMITEKWLSCVVLLQIMCISFMWYPIHAINLNLLQVKGRSDLYFRLEIIKRAIGLIILISTLPFGLEAFCWGGVIGSIVSLVINTYYTGILINAGFIAQMKDISHILILSLVMYFVSYIISIQFINEWMQLCVGISIAVCIYILGATLFRFPEVKEAIQFIKKDKKNG